MEHSKTPKRIIYYDFLRILATISVVSLHTAAQNWSSVNVESFEWNVFNVVDSATRWGVPIFVMISGALFLNSSNPLNVKKLYQKNIIRIMTAFLFWSAVYAADNFFMGTDLKSTISSFIKGKYHLWFLYMITGLYIITPILRGITVSKKITEYTLMVGFIFIFLIPWLFNLLNCLQLPYTSTGIKALNAAFTNTHLCSNSEYIVYFILGHYISHYEISDYARKPICIIFTFIAGYLTTIGLTIWYSVKLGKPNVLFYSNSSVNVLLMSVSIFLFAKYILSKIELSQKGLKILEKLSKYTFGAYLVHVLVLEKINEWFHFNTLSCHPIISVLILIVCTTILSFIISAVLNHFPKLNKYIT